MVTGVLLSSIPSKPELTLTNQRESERDQQELLVTFYPHTPIFREILNRSFEATGSDFENNILIILK